MARRSVPAWLTGLAIAGPVALFLGVYLPAAGRGFIQDDYVWVLQSRVRGASDFLALFHQDNGFYRPLVAVTFAVDEWLFGIEPRGYGVTNVLLALACAGSIAALARAFRLSHGASITAGALWLLNFQGIRMAVLWTSGRTSLVVTLAATAAATALVRSWTPNRKEGRASARPGWLIASFLSLAAALFFKEEAVLLPLVLLVWLLVLRPASPRPWGRIAAWTSGAAAMELLYFLARASTHAMTLDNAPSYYRLTFAPAAVLENVVSYADRVATLPVAVTLLAGLVLHVRRAGVRPALRTPIVLAGMAWIAGMFGITIFVPVRSDLYAVQPSVGACLIAAVVCDVLWRDAPVTRQRLALLGLLALLLVSIPVYVARTSRYVQPAEFATAVLSELRPIAARLPEGSRIILTDERRQAPGVEHRNLSDAFGSLIGVAIELTTGRRMAASIGPASGGSTEGIPDACASCPTTRLVLSDGHLRILDAGVR